MRLTIAPFESVTDDLPRAVAKPLRTILPWRFTVSARLPDPTSQGDTRLLGVEELWIQLPASSRHDEMVVGLTGRDLASSELKHVFGYACPERRAAIVSVFSLVDGTTVRRGGRRLLVARTTKEILHEAGHLMGLTHCEHAGCVMQYSQTLHDIDIKQCRYCSDCLRELSRLPEPAGER